MKTQFQMLAGYNQWANRLVYAVAAELSESDYHANRGAFFGSLHNTLNHILLGDRIWLHRITGEGDAPDRLDAILYDNLSTLTAAREAEDARLISYFDSLDDAVIAGTLHYANMQGDRFEQPLDEVLVHVFNHQTHHRGQAHTLITASDHTVPSFDLIQFYRER
jgi:uncharacterized damage-inducible protein DinB